MKQYHELLETILLNGTKKEDRTGTGTISIFGHQMRFNLSDGFPLITTKKIHFKSVVHELLWFISGNTNIKYLNENGVKIWNEWADQKGDLGPVYGAQWRSWATKYSWVDQLYEVIQQIKTNPNSRRLIVSAWNVGSLHLMALPPCHTMFQFYVNENKLSCQLYQRSGDAFLGIPFNIASYALLTHMIAHVCKLDIGEFIHTLGDAHIYTNHLNQVHLQLTRDFKELPTLSFARKINDIDDFYYEDIILNNYDAHPHIKGDVSV